MNLLKRRKNVKNNIPSTTLWTNVKVVSGYYSNAKGVIQGKLTKANHKVVFNSVFIVNGNVKIYQAVIPFIDLVEVK